MSTFRNIALAGVLAASGCAGTQAAVRPTERHEPPRGRTAELATQTCPRQRTSRIQECMIEGIAGTCRSSSGTNLDAFYACVGEGLRQSVTPEAVQLSITVGPGEEVFSYRTGGPTMYQIAKLDAIAVDANGVEFNFVVERIETAAPTEVSVLDQTTVRANFDGTRTGEWMHLNFTEIWNFRVESAGSGRARVSFQTDNPAMIVRGAGTPGAAPAREQPPGEATSVQRPPVQPPPQERQPTTITSPD